MRYESKHRHLKVASGTTCNTMNLLKSLALRNQLRLAYLKLIGNLSYDNLIFDHFKEIDEFSRRKYFPRSCITDEIFSTDCVESNGIEYKEKMVFVVEMGPNDLLVFGKVIEILIKEKQVFLVMQPLVSIFFDEKFFAYNVVARETYILKNCLELPNIHPCLLVEKGENCFVACKYVL